MMRRRLATGWGLEPEKFGFKPFGGQDYGYRKLYGTVASWTIWALVTWGSFSVDPYEGALVLGAAVAYSEYAADDPKRRGTSGSSWIHNIQAGYCWYHYFVKGARGWPVFLGSLAELAGDTGAVVEEYLRGRRMYGHRAHLEGASIGMAAAFLLDVVNPKKGGRKTSFWFKAIFASMALLLSTIYSK